MVSQPHPSLLMEVLRSIIGYILHCLWEVANRDTGGTLPHTFLGEDNVLLEPGKQSSRPGQ